MGAILYIRAKASVHRFFVVELGKLRYCGYAVIGLADLLLIIHHVLFPSHIFLMTDAAAAAAGNRRAGHRACQCSVFSVQEPVISKQ